MRRGMTAQTMARMLMMNAQSVEGGYMQIRHFTFGKMDSEPELAETIETEDITVLAGYITRGLTFMDACPDGSMVDVYSFPSSLHALAFATTVMAIRLEDD
jgi:hypothetical protein